MRLIKNELEALSVAVKIVDAQEKLLIAYRVGGRPPGGAIDYLGKHKPRLEEWRERSLATLDGVPNADEWHDDARTAAQGEAEATAHFGPPDFSAPNDRTIKWATYVQGFTEGAVWAQERVTPTRERLVELLNSHDLDRRYGATGTDWRCICEAEFGKLDGWKEHRADAILALLAGLAEGES